MGKSVFGRLMVDLRSRGTRAFSQIVDFFHYREGTGERLFGQRNGTKVLLRAGGNVLLQKVAICVQFSQVTFPSAKHLKLCK
jgi:hypothetical protein